MTRTRMCLSDPMNTTPRTDFVPSRPSTAYRYDQRPPRITREEARRAAENRKTYLNAKAIAEAAIARGAIRMPGRAA